MRHLALLLALVPFPRFAHAAPPPLQEQGAQADAKAEEKKNEITLERLFPEKRFFGRGARNQGLSRDGRYAAFLWTTWVERRHGSDLYIHDFDTGETRRVTSAVTMEPFRQQAHKVAEDRRERAKKREKKDADASEKEGGDGAEKKEKSTTSGSGTAPDGDEGAQDEKKEQTGDTDRGDVVDEDDADREDGPRWDGVASATWSPVGDELLFLCGGDVYRWKAADGAIDRLTMTRDGEARVEWLPDGSGFLFQQGGALRRVVFGDSGVVQIDPALPSGQSLGSFEISPDGKKLAFLATKGERGFMAGGRTVKIADYEDRFMTVREVPRQVSDDPFPDLETTVYVYELPSPMREDGTLHRLYTHKHTGPRDQIQTPDWAPDSSRVTFGSFRQTDGQVEVREAILPRDEPSEGSWAELVAKAKGEDPATVEGEKKDGEQQDGKKDERKEEQEQEQKKDDDGGQRRERRREREVDPTGAGPSTPASEPEIHELEARVVYRFLHQGGPNTPSMVEPHYTADSRHILFLSEQSGFRHLGLLDPLYESYEALTRGPFEVYLGALPESRAFAVVLSTREGPECQDAYRVDLSDGSMTRLTSQHGQYSSIAVSEDGQRLVGSFGAYGRLEEFVAIDVAKGEQKDLTDSHSEEARALTQAVPEFFRFENRHGHRLSGMLFKPDDWKAEDRRPCLIYVYGGPLGTRKEVVQGSYSGSSYFFAWYMAKKHGYVTATIDTRGMSGYGAVFEKANFEQVGKPQVEDLVDGARWLVENAGADPERVGLHGWSFGGFQTQMCMYTEPDVFACGIAGAGPTEWENYNSWYSTGTIGESRTGKPDLAKYSLLPLAKNLKHKLLLLHGMEDSNVLYQDTVRVYGELLKAGKETLVELFLDPSGGHGMGGHVKSLGRYKKYEEFLVRCLGEGAR